MLNNLTYFTLSLIAAFTEIICYKNINNRKLKIKPIWIIILLVGCIINMLFISPLGSSIIKPIYSLIFFGILIYYTYKIKIREAISYTIIYWLYGLIIDFLTMLIISGSGILNYIKPQHYIYMQFVATFIMTILLFAISKIPITKKFTKNIINKMANLRVSLIIDGIIILFLIFLNVICVINLNKISIQLLVVTVVGILIMFVYAVIDKNYSISKLKQVNDLLLKNNEFFLKLDTDHRTLKHNLTHQLNSIKSVADEKTKKLIEDLIITYNAKFISTQDIGKIPKGINGIVYEKIYTFENKEIKFAVENTIESDLLELITPRTYNNLCETLGVLMDNALEATSESEEKTILIDFSEEKDHINIKIYNTFNNLLDIDKIGTKDYSTKKRDRKRGIGLFSIFRKNNIRIKNSIINNLFVSEIKIKKALYK